MNLQDAQKCLAKLKAAYQSSKPLDEIASELYTETLMEMHIEDVSTASKDIIQSSKFFPSIAEIVEAVDFCKGRRLKFDESRAREKRLTSSEDAIMDPRSDIHKRVVGPNHARFLRLLSGEEKFPEPEWMKRKKPAPMKSPSSDTEYVPISDSDRRRREDLLRQQARMLIANEVQL